MNPTPPHQRPNRLAGQDSERLASRPADGSKIIARENASPAGPKNKRRIRNYLINSSVQLRIALTNLGYMLLVVLVILLSVLIPQYLEMWQPGDPHYQLAAAKLFLLLLDQMVLAVVAIFILAFAHQVLMTHKICGPLVNFSNTFQAIRNLDLTRKVRLRRSDLLKRTASEINEMSSALANHIGRIKADHEALEKNLAAAAAHLNHPQDLARILASARKHANSCRGGLTAFSLPDPMCPDHEESSAAITADGNACPPLNSVSAASGSNANNLSRS